MADTPLKTPYSSAVQLVAELPTWTDEYDAQRLAAYSIYEDLYSNAPEITAMLLRGSDDSALFIPSARRLVRTLARYVGRGWGYILDPELGEPSDRDNLKVVLAALFRREAILSTFANGKRDAIMLGDWVWFLSADPDKPQGSRLSVSTLDPRLYFPIWDDEDPSRITGARIVEEYLLTDGSTIALRIQTWLKPSNPEHPAHGVESGGPFPIAYKQEIVDLESWYKEDERKVLISEEELAELPGIYALPFYHIKLDVSEEAPFGRSMLAGLESVIAGINQAVTDEDLSLSMAGLGMFTTTAGSPVDDDGNQVNWQIGPARVIEHAEGTTFNRLKGIDTVEPVQDHLKYIEEHLYGSVGINEVALGRSNSAGESGVALALRLQPLFDAADDIDAQINAKMSQMFYDLITMWLPVYEGSTFGEAMVYSVCDPGKRMPFDRAQRWKELQDGYAAGFFSLEYVHKVLTEEMGYDLSSDDLSDALEETERKAAQADPYGARVRTELSG